MTVDLRAAAASHLAARRARGYRLADHDWLIRSCLDDLKRRGRTRITVVDALAFASQRPGCQQRWQVTRLRVIRDLARYVHELDPAAADLVPVGLIGARVIRRQPYLYSDEQVRALLAAASALCPTQFAATMHVFIGLLSVTGLRAGEAVSLAVTDLDTRRQVLAVTGKYRKRRLVPLHPSTIDVLTDYLADRPATGPLFVGTRGGRLNLGTAQRAFRALVGECQLTPPSGMRNATPA